MDANSDGVITGKMPETKKANLLKIRQVMAILNYSREWVQEAILDGRIKAVKLGGQYRVSPEEVERVLQLGIAAGKSRKKTKSGALIPAEPVKSPPAAALAPVVPPDPQPVAPPVAEVKSAPLAQPPKAPEKPLEKPKKSDFDLFGLFR